MRRFLQKILIFAICFLLFDAFFYLFLFLSPHLERDRRLERIINGAMNQEVIIMGSSRGARNIIACQISDSTGLSAFNLSYPGADISFQLFLLKSLVKFNTSPSDLLLAVDDPAELMPSEFLSFRYDRLYPLSIYNYINDELIARDQKSILAKILALARINLRNFDLRKKQFSPLDTLRKCGSMPLEKPPVDREMNYHSTDEYSKNREVKEQVEAFLAFQDICLSHGIRLHLVFSPNFKTHSAAFENRLRELSDPSLGYCIYDQTNPIYQDPRFFYDESHLTAEGATVFTREIIRYLSREKADR